jgi:hypothetical protein
MGRGIAGCNLTLQCCDNTAEVSVSGKIDRRLPLRVNSLHYRTAARAAKRFRVVPRSDITYSNCNGGRAASPVASTVGPLLFA